MNVNHWNVWYFWIYFEYIPFIHFSNENPELMHFQRSKYSLPNSTNAYRDSFEAFYCSLITFKIENKLVSIKGNAAKWNDDLWYLWLFFIWLMRGYYRFQIQTRTRKHRNKCASQNDMNTFVLQTNESWMMCYYCAIHSSNRSVFLYLLFIDSGCSSSSLHA